MSSLLVPINVDALVLDDTRRVVGPDLDFARLPWAGENRDHNGDTPNVASAANAEPFRERLLSLGRGTHLHWSLPDALTRGGNRERPWAKEHVDDLFFPAVPNRWIVTRREPGDDIVASWLIESDFVHPATADNARSDDTDTLPVTFPHPRPVVGRAPFLRLGRAIALNGADAAGGLYLPDLGQRLTALGWGDPNFAALYANCRSVFGLHDAHAMSSPGVYDVFGWYGGGVPDALAALREDIAGRDDAALIARLNARPDATPLRKGAILGPELRREADRLHLLDAFGWRLPEGVELPETVLCHGRVVVDPDAAGAFEGIDRIDTPVALGHSGAEAFGALMAELMASDSAPRARIEEQMEALRLNASFADHKLDIGRKLTEARHTEQFDSAARRTLWAIRPLSETSGPVEAAPERELPRELGSALNRLNLAHHAYDMAMARVESLRSTLFEDWHLWMQARYPRNDHHDFAVDVNALARLLRRDLTELTALIAATGTLRQGMANRRWSVGVSAGDSDSRAAAVEEAHRAVRTTMATAGLYDTMHLVRVPGPRFWRPKDPVVLLTHPMARPSPRHGQDGNLAVSIFALTPARIEISAALASALTLTAADGEAKGLLSTRTTEQGRHGWNPFLLEWNVRTEGLKDGANTGSDTRHYDRGFLRRNYTLPLEGPDLAATGAAGHSNLHTPLRGRCLLSGRAETLFVDRVIAYLGQATGSGAALAVAAFEAQGRLAVLAPAIEAFWSREGAASRVAAQRDASAGRIPDDPLATLLVGCRRIETDGLRPLSQRLGGFYDALAGRRQELQLPIADPLGFPEEQTLTDEIAAAVGGDHRPSPAGGAATHPITSGRMEIVALRLVDTFGRFVDWTPRDLITSETVAHPQVARARIPPRLVQPARLAVDWLSAADDEIELTAHPATSPVCGWLLPSHLDHGSLAVHSADGRYLGQVDRRGRWRIAPGPGLGPRGPDEIANRHLAALVHWFTHRPDEAMFMPAFTRLLDDALDGISVTDFNDTASRALLAGRPIAVVRVRVSLELLGPPLTDVSFADLVARLNGASRSSHGVENVLVPLRIGEHGILGDGVVGFWIESDADDGLDAAYHERLFWSPQPPGFGTIPTHPDIARIGAYTEHPERLHLSPDGTALTVTLLLDPRANAHFTTGILPVKSLKLPETQHRQAMGRIGMTFLSAPVLSGSARIETPVPVQSGGEWVWIERRGEDWSETAAAPHVSRVDLIRAYPKSGDELWESLGDAGWLEIGDDDAPARFSPPAPGTPLRLTGHTEDEARDVLGVLSTIADGIRRPARHAGYSHASEAREGWLQFRPLADTSQEP